MITTKYHGIYIVENTLNGKCYVGQSAVDVHIRCDSHIKAVTKGFDNRHLVNAVRKYGIENFSFKVILYCEEFELTRYEDALIQANRPNRYNIRDAADSNKGIKMPEDTVNKHRVENLADSTRHKMSSARLGKILSDETKARMSAAFIGNKRAKGHTPWNKGGHISEEQKQEISKALTGRRHPMTDAQKQSISHTLMGHDVSEESKSKMSKSARNRLPISDDTRHKQSDSQKARRQREHDNKLKGDII